MRLSRGQAGLRRTSISYDGKVVADDEGCSGVISRREETNLMGTSISRAGIAAAEVSEEAENLRAKEQTHDEGTTKIKRGTDNRSAAGTKRHAEDIVKGMGLTREPRSPDALGKERPDEGESGSEEMNAADAKRYRALEARANHQVSDHIDVQYSTEEACRHTRKPVVGLGASQALGPRHPPFA